ncbi:hypothetical protein GP486_002198 [Trichoglossum hirsutum]|uniref:Uncharacterized protein n=1 Tax=Trichoglossum hirsutum TaxID=265104 RepID=A0A9P8LFN4_9PEZI|nr:hypothetical protein GP486_002198 [Trichoglossum hirsutum]
MSMTLLSYLTRANPVLVIDTSAGTNTDSMERIPIEGVCDWTEFSYSTLHSIFQDSWEMVISAHTPVLDEGLPLCEIYAEDGLGHLIATWNVQVVSRALRESGGKLLIATGSSAQMDPDVIPDWAGIQKARKNPGRKTYQNQCPGDTKLSSKWASKWDKRFTSKWDWELPFCQVQFYCAMLNARYGYILTDEELVVIRVTKSVDPPPRDRPRRSTAQYEPGHLRDLSDVSSALSEISLYRNTGQLENYEKLEIKSVPWSNQGSDKFTVNLALWCLLSMAAANNSIETRYPPLDSWRLVQEGSGLTGARYCHVTSGKITSSLPAGAYVLPTHTPAITTADPVDN